MTLRPATIDDEHAFYQWRQWAEKRGLEGGWYIGQQVTRDGHHSWFVQALAHCTLLVWQPGRTIEGVARIDKNGEVAPYTLLAQMPALLRELHPYASEHGGRLKLTIDRADVRMVHAAISAGWPEYPVAFHCYRQ